MQLFIYIVRLISRIMVKVKSVKVKTKSTCVNRSKRGHCLNHKTLRAFHTMCLILYQHVADPFPASVRDAEPLTTVRRLLIGYSDS